MILYKLNTSTLQYEAVKIKRSFKLPILVAAVFLILGFSSAIKVNTVIEKVPILMEKKEEACDTTLVRQYIAQLNLRFPNIVYQQVLLESGNLTSPVFKELNNLLGMQTATLRATTGLNVGTRFAKYNTWKESLMDYALWQEAYTRDIKTEADYYWFLDKIYCEDDKSGVKYSDRLEQMK